MNGGITPFTTSETTTVAERAKLINQLESARVDLLNKQNAAKKEGNSTARIDVDSDYKKSLDKVEEKRVVVKQELQDEEISKREALKQEIAIENERYQIQVEYWKKVKKLAEDGSKEQRNASEKLLEVDEDRNLRIAKITKTYDKEILEDYKKTFEQIGSSLSTAIMGMITHTTTLKQALADIAKQIIQTFINMGIKIVADWAANMAKMAAESALITGLTGGLGGGVSSILSALSIPSFDSGTSYIPHDMLAVVHQGERVVTASENAALSSGRAFLGSPSAGGGANTVHASPTVHIHNYGSGELDHRAVMSAVAKGVQRGVNLGMRGL